MTTTTKTTPASTEQLGSKLAYLTRVLKTPTIGRTWEHLADAARTENWSHEEYLAAVLERRVADRESAGATMRIRTAHFPHVKTREDFNLEHLPSLRKDLPAHLATVTFVPKAENVVLLGPPGIGKTHLAIALGITTAQAGYSVLLDTATNWIARLANAHHAGALEAELKKIRRYKPIIIDEVGYIPFDHDAANLFFQLVASRYEQGSILVTSNLPFGRWGEVFGDEVVAAAMTDRLVHHAEVLTLAGESYRTRERRELLTKDHDNRPRCSAFSRRHLRRSQPTLTTSVRSDRRDRLGLAARPGMSERVECQRRLKVNPGSSGGQVSVQPSSTPGMAAPGRSGGLFRTPPRVASSQVTGLRVGPLRRSE